MNNWNKIVNLYFLDDNGIVQQSVLCPQFGRKPEIEINAELAAGDALNALHITVKSLYIAEIGRDYPKIRIEAGYYGRLSTLEAQVVNIWQSEPGPDSKTNIVCHMGNVQTWLTGIVSGSVEPGGSLSDAMNVMSNALGLETPQVSSNVADLKTDAGISFSGTAREALQKIKKNFPSVIVTSKGGLLCAYSASEPASASTYNIDFISAPIQYTTGGQSVAMYYTLTAPWIPDIRCGDIVRFPSKYYEPAGVALARNAPIKASGVVDFISLHFATVGTINKMVLSGHITEQTNG